MLNPKFSIVFSVCGFVVSFLIALLSGVSFSVMLLRALLVAAVFFILSVLIHLALTHFLPELLQPQDFDRSAAEYNDNQLGSMVDVSVGDSELPKTKFDSAENSDTESYAGTMEKTGVSVDETPVSPTVSVVDGLSDLPDFDSGPGKPSDDSKLDIGKKAATPDSGTSISEAASMAKAIQTMLAHDN